MGRKFDAVIFDVDGVLVDVSQSYRSAIKESVMRFAGKKVYDEDINALKLKEGFNNDWDVSYVLAFSRSEPLTIAEKENSEYLALKDIFQELYLGSELFAEVYGRSGPTGSCNGFINNETLLVNEDTLARLKSSGFSLGIVTSRPRFEALYALKSLVPEYFSEASIIALEDCPKEKPSPDPILLAIERLGCKNPVFIGDSYNDVLAAERAGIPCVFLGREKLGDLQIDDVNKVRIILEGLECVQLKSREKQMRRR